MDFSALEHNGIILTADLVRAHIDKCRLDGAITAGELVRLRRGAFCRRSLWDAWSERERHLARIAAVGAAARTPVVFARESAAALWDIPVASFPDHVVILDRWKGGGRSEDGVTRTARGASTATSVHRAGRLCTTLARTALDLARTGSFVEQIPLLDAVLWRENPLAITREELAAEAVRARCSAQLLRAVAFASPLSGSVGESEARAVIHLLGFPPPELQRRFVDAEGEMFPDFTWMREGVMCEFDGKIKYTREKYTGGDPSQVVWREKLREDRLRRQIRVVTRIVTSDVKQPPVLARKLRDAGLVAGSRGRGGS